LLHPEDDPLDSISTSVIVSEILSNKA